LYKAVIRENFTAFEHETFLGKLFIENPISHWSWLVKHSSSQID